MASKVTSCLDGFQCCLKDGTELNFALHAHTHTPHANTHSPLSTPMNAMNHSSCSTIHQSDCRRIRRKHAGSFETGLRKKKKAKKKEVGVLQVHACQSSLIIQRPVEWPDNGKHFPLCRFCYIDTEGRFVTRGLQHLEALYIISMKNSPVWRLLIIYHLQKSTGFAFYKPLIFFSDISLLKDLFKKKKNSLQRTPWKKKWLKLDNFKVDAGFYNTNELMKARSDSFVKKYQLFCSTTSTKGKKGQGGIFDLISSRICHHYSFPLESMSKCCMDWKAGRIWSCAKLHLIQFQTAELTKQVQTNNMRY